MTILVKNDTFLSFCNKTKIVGSHYENLPMQYTEMFKVVKNEKNLIFFLLLLKT